MTVMVITILGFVAASLTTTSFLPQLIKTWKTKETKDISRNMYVILTVGLFLWFIYGIYINSWPMIVSNAVGFFFAICILVLKLKHG